jgi:hypothetical protein
MGHRHTSIFGKPGTWARFVAEHAKPNTDESANIFPFTSCGKTEKLVDAGFCPSPYFRRRPQILTPVNG